MSSKVTSAQESFLTRLEEFHKNWCEPIDWKQRSLKPFNKGQLGPGEAMWATKLQSYEPPMLERYIGIHKVKPMYWQYKKRKAANEDLKLYQEWEVNHPFVQQVMSGDQDVWREVVRLHATFHQEQTIAKSYSLHKYDQNTAECDVFLHSMEEVIPSKIEYATKRGQIRYRDFPKTKRIILYESYVYSCLVRVARELFAVLPCRTIYLNGLLGSAQDHFPILSAILERNALKARGASPHVLLQKNRTLVAHKKRTGFHQIDRVYSPCIMNQDIEVKP